MYCVNCGAEMADSAAQCPNCAQIKQIQQDVEAFSAPGPDSEVLATYFIDVPPEVASIKFLWPAFLLGIIWALGNRVWEAVGWYAALLALYAISWASWFPGRLHNLTFVAIIYFCIRFPMRAARAAWETGRFSSPQQFAYIQKIWLIVALCLVPALFILSFYIGLVLGVIDLIRGG